MCNIKGMHNGACRLYYYLHCGFDDFDDIDQQEDMFACDDEHQYNFEHMLLRRGVKRLMIQVVRGNREADRKRTGISGLSAYVQRPTLNFTRSFPYDTLHFILQNLVPQLIKLWFGDTLFDNQDDEDRFLLGAEIWEVIGKSTTLNLNILYPVFQRVITLSIFFFFFKESLIAFILYRIWRWTAAPGIPGGLSLSRGPVPAPSLIAFTGLCRVWRWTAPPGQPGGISLLYKPVPALILSIPQAYYQRPHPGVGQLCFMLVRKTYIFLIYIFSLSGSYVKNQVEHVMCLWKTMYFLKNQITQKSCENFLIRL